MEPITYYGIRGGKVVVRKIELPKIPLFFFEISPLFYYAINEWSLYVFARLFASPHCSFISSLKLNCISCMSAVYLEFLGDRGFQKFCLWKKLGVRGIFGIIYVKEIQFKIGRLVVLSPKS